MIAGIAAAIRRRFRQCERMEPAELPSKPSAEPTLPYEVMIALDRCQVLERPGESDKDVRRVIMVKGTCWQEAGEADSAQALRKCFPDAIKTDDEARLASSFLHQAIRQRARARRRKPSWVTTW